MLLDHAVFVRFLQYVASGIRIIFTDGLRDGQGVLVIDFEIDGTQFAAHSNTSSIDSDRWT